MRQFLLRVSLVCVGLSLNPFAMTANAAVPTADIQMGTPQYGGNGCPKDSVSVTFAPDNSSVSIIYDQFTAKLDSSEKRHRDRALCDVILPMQLPAGMSVSVSNVDYRLYANLPANAKGLFQASQTFFPLQRRWWNSFVYVEKRFNGVTDDDFTISSADQTQRQATSVCGGQVYLRLSEALQLKSRGAADAEIDMDSADGSFSGTYHLALKKCK